MYKLMVKGGGDLQRLLFCNEFQKISRGYVCLWHKWTCKTEQAIFSASSINVWKAWAITDYTRNDTKRIQSRVISYSFIISIVKPLILSGTRRRKTSVALAVLQGKPNNFLCFVLRIRLVLAGENTTPITRQTKLKKKQLKTFFYRDF